MDSPFPPRCDARFEAKKMLASGSFGSVFLARQRSLDRNAAVKLLHIDPRSNPIALSRFVREAKIAAQLRHAHIVEILDQDVEDEVPWIAYEYLAGGSVDGLLRDMGAMRWPDAVRLAYQVATALACAHAGGILHRDVKPGNVLVAGPGRYKLGDFGIARKIDATVLTMPGALVGTLAYVAPEQVRGDDPVPASDVYSLGVMLFELITGQRLFPDATPGNILAKHMNEEPRRPSSVDRTVPAELDAVVLKSLAKQVSDRYTTADAFALALAELSSRCSGFERPLDLALLPERPANVAPRAAGAARADGTDTLDVTPQKVDDLAARWPGRPDGTPKARPVRVPVVVLAVALAMILGGVGTLAAWYIQQKFHTVPIRPPITVDPTPTPIPTKESLESPPPGMVPVAAGTFRMGHDEPGAHWHPEHEVWLDTFWIDRTEVTNAQYEAFRAATHHRPHYGLGQIERDFERPDHPVVGVSWDDALAYARWAHKRLPTEAEWEKAARGTDRRTFPWGDKLTAGARLLNTGVEVFLTGLDDPFPYTAPVSEFTRGASPCGALNMAGNVAEWCADNWDEHYYDRSPRRDPRGPERSEMRAVRGGHWHDPTESARTYYRHGRDAIHRSTEVGFRCAWSRAPER